MKTITLLAQKGGTGKTTLSVHLAVRAQMDGFKVLLIDTDPQGSVMAWWRRRRENLPDTIASRGSELAVNLGTASRQGYQFVIVDTAPHDSTDAGLCARLSNHVYIPTRPAILDLDAIGASTELVTEAKVPATIVLNACPPPSRMGESRITSEARQALTVYGIRVNEAAVSQRASFSHALIDGRAINEFDPRSKASAEINRLWQSVAADLDL